MKTVNKKKPYSGTSGKLPRNNPKTTLSKAGPNNGVDLTRFPEQLRKYIPSSSYHSIKELILCNLQLEEIAGLESCMRLEILDVSSNRLRGLIGEGWGIDQLNSLKCLRCFGNYFTGFCCLSRCVALQEIEAMHNCITSLSEIGPLRNLSSLVANNNQITNISGLSKMKNLETLNLSYNLFSDLSELSSLSNLKDLDLSFTRCTSLTPISKLPKLQTLSLRQTRLSSAAPLRFLTKSLQVLDVSNNSALDIHSLPCLINLTDISLSSLNLEQVDFVAQLYPNLESLDISHNRISDVEALYSLAASSNLLDLRVENNPFTTEDFREFLSVTLPSLDSLDDQPVSVTLKTISHDDGGRSGVGSKIAEAETATELHLLEQQLEQFRCSMSRSLTSFRNDLSRLPKSKEEPGLAQTSMRMGRPPTASGSRTARPAAGALLPGGAGESAAERPASRAHARLKEAVDYSSTAAHLPPKPQ